MKTFWKWFPVLWFIPFRLLATDVTVAWDRHSSHTNLTRWELTVNDNNALTTFNIPTNQTTFVITNLPCGNVLSLNVVAVNVVGLKSDPSNTLRVQIPCAPVLRIQLEASANLRDWWAVSNLAIVKIDPVESARFYRVAQTFSRQ